MSILILGGRGNLGSQLTKVFSADYETISLDREDLDVLDFPLLRAKIAEVKPDLIINTVAYNAVDKCEDNDEEYDLAKKINIDGPKFLAEACLKIGATLIHYSTDYVFDGAKEGGYDENDEPKPINRYGKTKFHGEKRILELSGSGLKWYLIRTSKLFGPKGESEITKPSFFEIILEQSRKKPKLEIIDEELSCFTFTPDLARATKELVEKNSGYGLYHIVNSGACTWFQAAVELFKIADPKVEVKPVTGEKFDRPAKRPKFSVLLNTKLPPLRDYREALREYLNKCKM